jgi:hypothetical protein
MQRALHVTVLLLLACGSANSGIVILSFDGTYDTAESSVFGQTGAAVPYSFQITYDTSLDTNTEFFGTGVPLGTDTTTHEWYGYSASGIIATSLTFGTQTWSGGDLESRVPADGVEADFWLDTDLSSSTPSRAWLNFDATDGRLQLGGGQGGGGEISMIAEYSRVDDSNESSDGSSSNMQISSDIDVDGDGLAEQQDNCTLIANPSQCDSDGDGYGNHCDGDLDNNGFTNAFDTPLFRAQLGQPSAPPTYNEADLNCNGFVNAFDTPLFRSLLGSSPGPSGLVVP